jgi:OHCU decarboxylase
MAGRRPFTNLAQLLEASEQIASELDSSDWLEAFSAHPKIGDRSGSSWSKQEQSRAGTASESVSSELANLNQQYQDKFGFVFLICATGKSAEEILVALKRRLGNTREEELAQAAREQRLITQIRIRKLLGL